MRILVVGAGVIGSVYAGRFQIAGHETTLLARGCRYEDLRRSDLVLLDAASGRQDEPPVTVVDTVPADGRFDLVVVAVRGDQLPEVLPLVAAVANEPEVVVLGNATGQTDAVRQALGGRERFGFPAVGGVRDGTAVRYVQIGPQKTMLAEPAGARAVGLRRVRRLFEDAGFPVIVARDADGWVRGHTLRTAAPAGHGVLASDPAEPSRGIVVRRARPSRVHRNGDPRGRAAAGGGPRGTPDAQPGCPPGFAAHRSRAG